MPSTTWTREEFALVTNDDGTPSIGSFVHVALDITYHRDGEWQIDTAGFVNGWKNRWSPNVEWLPTRNALEELILERAETLYREDIDEHVRECLSDDAAEAEDVAFERLKERRYELSEDM